MIKIIKKKTTKGYGKVKSIVNYQKGTSNNKVDSKRQALPPGFRRSSTGKVYKEVRKNRSDKPGKRT